MVNVLPTMNPNYFLFFYLPIAHHFPDYNYVVFFFSLKLVNIFLTRILIGCWCCVFYWMLIVRTVVKEAWRRSAFYLVLWLLITSLLQHTLQQRETVGDIVFHQVCQVGTKQKMRFSFLRCNKTYAYKGTQLPLYYYCFILSTVRSSGEYFCKQL